MAYIPFGYKQHNGIIVIDENAADTVRKIFNAYLSGASYVQAGRIAGIDCYHSSVKNILRNRKYLGTDRYPAIIDADTFAAVNDRMNKTTERLRKERRKPKKRVYVVSTAFRLRKITDSYSDPYLQAEYQYSLIEGRQND